MTKSIKEKTRQQKIREHILNGSPVPAELLKIQISYHNKYLKCFSITFNENFIHPKNKTNKRLTPDEKIIIDSIYNANWLKANLNNHVKDLIINKIVDIANSIKIYDFKVNALIIAHKDDRFSFDYYFGCRLQLFVTDFRNNIIGQLHFELEDDDIIEIIEQQKLNFIDFSKSPSTILKILFSDFKTAENFLILNSHYKFRNFQNDSLKSEIKKINNIVENMSCYIKNLNRASSKIKVTNLIEFQQSYYQAQTYTSFLLSIYIYSECYKLDFFKNLVKNGFLDINIPEEELVLENIDYIQSMFELLKY